MRNLFILSTLLPLIYLFSCTDLVEDDVYYSRTLSQIKNSGELRVITINGSSSYFVYEDKEMGYEYEKAKYLASALGVELKVIISPNTSSMTNMLLEGKGDIIAFPISYSECNSNSNINSCGPSYSTRQVLIKRVEQSNNDKNEIYELIGKEITVEENSKFHRRLINLNEELGGGILINAIKRDTLSSEVLIDMVAGGDIDYTISDDNLARLNKTLYSNLDISLPISLYQQSSWVLPNGSDSLKLFVDSCFRSGNKTPEYAAIAKRYYAKSHQQDVSIKYLLNDGRLSVYDHLFKKYAPQLGWDWRLLAAISFEESRFNPEASSKAGARGLMQLMPITARHNGLADENITDPEANIEAGTKLISYLQKRFSRIEDSEERIKFVLGAFHSGLGHIYDAVSMARKYGYADSIWDYNVAHCLTLKNDPSYFSDTTIVKYGAFPGDATTSHVENIMERYEEFKDKVNL